MADSSDSPSRKGHVIRGSPLHEAATTEKVKFRVGEEIEPLMKDNDENLRHMFYNDMPRPSLASFSLTSAADLSRSNMPSHIEKRQSVYFDAKSTSDAIPVLVELFDLQIPESGAAEWEETARWIKYEEDVEGVDHHWGRPHVAFLAFHSLIQLRHCFSKGLFLLDLQASNYDEIRQKITESMKKRFKIDDTSTNAVLNALGQNHKHVPEHHFFFKSVTHANLLDSTTSPVPKKRDNGATLLDKVVSSPTTTCVVDEKKSPDILPRVSSSSSFRRLSKQISFLKMAITPHAEEYSSTDVLRKIPERAECAQVFVGALPQLQKVRFAMVRLATALPLPELLDAPIPIRFIFVVLGPPLPDVDYHELGRAISTLMANENFKEIAYSALSTEAFLLGMDEFVDQSIVVPPGEIDHRSLISVDDIKKALKNRKKRKDGFEKLRECEPAEYPYEVKLSEVKAFENGIYKTELLSERIQKKRDPLQRTGRFFGGLIEDVKSRFAVYKSDFTDAFHFQIITSLVFMFFAAFSPAIGFGGLLGEKTNGIVGTSETLVAQCVCGVIWGFFSCQPMLIMAATGPVLVFEASLYKFCDDNEIEFLVFRFWAAIWVLLICIICVMFEASFMVRYVTRFTEDIFATLIPLVFVYESFKFLIKNFIYHPLQPLNEYCYKSNLSCAGTILENSTSAAKIIGNPVEIRIVNTSEISSFVPIIVSPLNVNLTADSDLDIYLREIDSYSINHESQQHHEHLSLKNQPDTALLSVVLLLATFVLAFKLRELRNSYFFGRTMRRAIGDFGVPIAILVVVTLYILFLKGPYLQHLAIPDSFSTTIPGRGWLVSPLGITKSIPVWAVFASLVPALFVFILFFVETEITQSLLSMEERGLKKSMGFHSDLMLVGLCTVVCSLMGLPWMCSATVQTLAHSSSLTIMKRHAPGERAQVDRVLEQRVTTIGVALLTGACAFLGFILKNIPLAVLFGIFLYLGIMNMLGVQFLHRMILMLVPQKYYPDYPYCQQVSMRRMHLYTLVQLACFIILWICKSIQVTSLAFPLVLMLIALFRKFVLPMLFQAKELEALDGHAESDKEHEEDEDFYSDAGWPM